MEFSNLRVSDTRPWMILQHARVYAELTNGLERVRVRLIGGEKFVNRASNFFARFIVPCREFCFRSTASNLPFFFAVFVDFSFLRLLFAFQYVHISLVISRLQGISIRFRE